MITIFTIPKAFTGQTAIHQENAIRSWLALKPTPEIILFGNDPGVAAAAKRLHVKHVPNVKRNEYGTPLLNDVFAKADKRASHDILCYVNTDILFLNDFVNLVARVPHHQFLVVGQRFDVRYDEAIDFSKKLWRRHVQQHLLKRGSFYVMGMDYFIYRKGLYKGMPPLAVGRSSWDSWLVHAALEKNIPVIDATQSILVVHQQHDYGHVRWKNIWDNPEALKNLKLSGFDKSRPPNFYDANYLLTPHGLKPARSLLHFGQRLYHVSTKYKILFPLYVSLKLVRKLGPVVHRLKKSSYFVLSNKRS